MVIVVLPVSGNNYTFSRGSIAGEMALACMQAVGLSVSPGLTFLTKCQNHSESLSHNSQPHISHKMSESLGEEPNRESSKSKKSKNPVSHFIIFIILTSIKH